MSFYQPPPPKPRYSAGGYSAITVPLELHDINRKRLSKRLKQRHDVPEGAFVVLEGGKNETRYSSDTELIFRQESYFHWAFGVLEPDCYGAIEVDTGHSIVFMPELDESYAIWMGKIQPPEHFVKKYVVDEVHFYKDDAKIVEVLKNKGPSVLLRLKGQNTDSKKITKAADFNGITQFNINDTILHPEITELRVFKTEQEVDVIRSTCRISGEAHKEVMRKARPGLYEYHLESIFRSSVTFQGCRHLAYTPIVASGPNSSVLHYGHAGAPNDRRLESGDLCLCDMGAEYYCYASDLTCTFPVTGKFTPEQRVIFNAVSAANKQMQIRTRIGHNWLENHRIAERTILTHLRDYGMLKGEVDDMMKVHLGAVFMPHGVGHFLGLDTHDVGGYPEGTSRINEPGVRNLRTIRTLEKDMVITAEPGCYFIDKLMDEALANPDQNQFINGEVFEKFRGFGGEGFEQHFGVNESPFEIKGYLTTSGLKKLIAVGCVGALLLMIRLEDVLVVGPNVAELFVLLPRTADEVEQHMASSKR